MQCFRAHFGVGPKAIVAMLKDLSSKQNVGHIMIMLCWLKLYETKHIMSGRWGYSEEFCRDIVKQTATTIQCLKAKKIRFGPFESKKTYIGTVN